MFAIIGIVIVLGSVLGGYLLSHGPIMVLVQPYEFMIIGGAAFGTLFIANPLPVVIGVFKGMLGIFKGSQLRPQEWSGKAGSRR
jgi:chemotaxis protein MotA